MAKAGSRKLKVFQAQLGFYDTVVAAPSRPAALSAWGVHQDLFASGQARLAEEPEAVKAALAHPEVPLRRAVGSADAFAVEPTSLPAVPDAPRKKPSSVPATKRRAAPVARPEADRSPLDAAEAALKAVDEARMREEAELQRRQDELDSAREASQSAYVERRKAAASAVIGARKAYRKAGGRD